MHKGAHSDSSACAPFFFIYAILRDSFTTLYDSNTCVNFYNTSIDLHSLYSQHRQTDHNRHIYHPHNKSKQRLTGTPLTYDRNTHATNTTKHSTFVDTIQFVKFYPILCLCEPLIPQANLN